jgi:hypothetical protein
MVASLKDFLVLVQHSLDVKREANGGVRPVERVGGVGTIFGSHYS